MTEEHLIVLRAALFVGRTLFWRTPDGDYRRIRKIDLHDFLDERRAYLEGGGYIDIWNTDPGDIIMFGSATLWADSVKSEKTSPMG